ncbi:retrovirus-related pol polyprotein from transposon TNT 1-94 [Tanacetum coccineum]
MNRLCFEAARTLLADSLLPTVFWVEAVNTACYVLNRVLVTKPHNKTPYELIIGRPPSISFMRPFGCPVTILNTLDPLGKFDGKAEEGFLVGYSVNSKAFRVFNSQTRKVEENLHVNFLENKPNVAGQGPNWLFDIDSLTNSMNYQPVTAGNQTNKNAGPQEANGDTGLKKSVDDRQSEEKNVSTQQYIVFPLWSSISSSYKSSDESYKNDTADDAAGETPVQKPASENEQALKNVLDKMIDQEKEASEQSDAVKKSLKHNVTGRIFQGRLLELAALTVLILLAHQLMLLVGNRYQENDKTKTKLNETEHEIGKSMKFCDHYTAPVTPPAYTPSIPFLATMEPTDTLLMRDEVISTIPARETDEFIKSSINDLVPILRESEETSDREQVVDFLMENVDVAGLPRHLVKHLFNHLLKNPSLTKGMSDVPLGDDSKPGSFDVTLLNPLFDFNDDYTLCYDNSLFDEEFEDISNLDPLELTLVIDEPTLLVTLPLPCTDVLGDAIVDTALPLGEHLDTLSTWDREIDFNPSKDIKELERLLADDLVPVPRVFDEPLDDSIPIKIDDRYYDSEGDILYFEQLLNEDTSSDVSQALLPTESSSLVLPLPDPK